MPLLTSITVKLPNRDSSFDQKLVSIFGSLVERGGNKFSIQKSDPSFVPDISFQFEDVPEPLAQFKLSDRTIEIPISNQTGQNRPPKIPFAAITIDDFMDRIKKWELARLDHVGFNLPWFDGVHPEILKLRKMLASASAYYFFPTGENWDFILPATEAELTNSMIDLNKDRHPKFEIVSFDMTSTPLIQIDCAVRQPYELIKQTFPEGIPEDNLKDTWVAIQNPYGIDIFFVIGELKDEDWSSFFEGHRLKP